MLGTTECWSSIEKAPSLLPVESDDELQDVLSKIDEENEDTSTLDRNSSPPIVPLETHPLNRDLRLSLGHPVTFFEDDLTQQAEASKLAFRKEKTIPIVRKSSSTTCFPELRIHSSIAEEDEETLCDEDAHEDESSIVDEVCSTEPPKFVENVSEAFAETIETLNLEERDSIFVKSDQGSFENKEEVNELNAFNEKILFHEEVDGLKEQELKIQPSLTDGDVASEAELKNSYCEVVSSVDNRTTAEEIEHHVGNGDGHDDHHGDGAEVNEVYETIKFFDEQRVNMVDIGLIIDNESKPLLSKLSITRDSDSVCKTEDSNAIPAISDSEIVRKEDSKINDDRSQGAVSALSSTEQSNCEGDCCSQTLLTAEEVLHHSPEVEELRETGRNVEMFATVTEVTNDVVECLPREEPLTIMEAPKIEIVEEHEVERELKAESVEVLVCSQDRLDSLGSNDDTSDTSTPVNSDTCEPSRESHQEGSNQNKEEGFEISQVSLPPSNKTGNNKKRRNKKKKKNQQQQQQQQQQTNNSQEKDSKNLKEMSLADNKEAIVTTSR